MGTLIILPFAAALAVISNKKFEEVLFPSIGLVILTLFVNGKIGSLTTGYYFLCFFLVLSCCIIITRRDKLKSLVFTPGFFAFIILFLFFLFFSYGRQFVSEAALSTYAPQVLSISGSGSLSDNYLYYNIGWPLPLVSIWAYYCSLSFNTFNEWVCIFAYDIFIISAILPLFIRIRYVNKDLYRWILMLLLCALLPIIKMPEAYSSYDMVIPQAVVLVYVYLMIYRILYGGLKTSSIIWYSVFAAYGLFFSSTITKYGFFSSIPHLIGIVCIIIISILKLYDKKHRNSLIVLLGILTLWTFAYVYFDVHIFLSNSLIKQEIKEYTDMLFLGGGESIYVIGKRVIPIFDATFIIISIIALVHISMKTKELYCNKAMKVCVFDIGYIFGAIIYLISLFSLYVKHLRNPELPQPPSMASYTAPIIITYAVLIFTQAYRIYNKRMVVVLGTLLVVACVYSDPVNATITKPKREIEYPLIEECKKEGLISFTGKDKIFYIDIDLVEDVPLQFKWEVFPAGTGSISGMNYNPEPNKWSDIEETISKDDLVSLIEEGGYTYVYIKNIDDFFYMTYYTRLGNRIMSNALYRVKYNKKGDLQLVFVAYLDQFNKEEEEQ